jgi:tellurite resistance protein
MSAVAPPSLATSSVKHLPVNLFAAVMGLSGLALAWRFAQARYGVSGFVADGIGLFAVGVFIALAMGYLAKAIRHPSAVKAEFSHPIASNFFGTISISLLLLSAVLGAYNSSLGNTVWVIGSAATLTLSFVVVGRLLRGKGDAAHAVPAWLIPGVATLDIAVTGAHMPMAWAGEVVLFSIAIGSVLALVMFTMIGTRLIQHEPLAGPMTPSLMIIVAPFEVGFLAYVNVNGEVDRFAALLFYFGLFMFLVLAPKVFRRSVNFGPTWWSISFPLAALSSAALKYASVHATLPLEALAGALLVFLTGALLVLTVRTVHILFNGRLLSA